MVFSKPRSLSWDGGFPEAFEEYNPFALPRIWAHPLRPRPSRQGRDEAEVRLENLTWRLSGSERLSCRLQHDLAELVSRIKESRDLPGAGPVEFPTFKNTLDEDEAPVPRSAPIDIHGFHPHRILLEKVFDADFSPSFGPVAGSPPLDESLRDSYHWAWWEVHRTVSEEKGKQPDSLQSSGMWFEIPREDDSVSGERSGTAPENQGRSLDVEGRWINWDLFDEDEPGPSTRPRGRPHYLPGINTTTTSRRVERPPVEGRTEPVTAIVVMDEVVIDEILIDVIILDELSTDEESEEIRG